MAKDKETMRSGFELDLVDLSGVELGSEDDSPKVSQKRDKEKMIDNYLKKMKSKGDFPIFSKQLGDINRILSSDYASANDIANVITQEFSLTNKLLKLVNSSFYGNFTRDGDITTITQAMIIVGTNQIQKASTSLIHFEHLQTNSQTTELMDISIGTFLSGMIAKDIVSQKVKKIDPEEAFICSMFHNLGLHLVMFYNYEDFENIKKRVELGNDRKTASREVLGISYEELGLGVAKKWGLPDYIVQSMERSKIFENDQKTSSRTKKDWLLNISFCANELCRAVSEESEITFSAVVKRFRTVFQLPEKKIKELVESAFNKIIKHSSTLNIDVNKSNLLSRIKSLIASEKSKPNKKAIFDGINNISETIQSPDYTYHMVLADIIDIMYEGFKYDRVLICIKDVKTEEFVCRYGKGKDFLDLLNSFRFKIDDTKSIFNITLERQRDIVITDLKESGYGDKIPEWFQNIIKTNTFVLYPIVIQGVPAGLFYADTMYKSILDSNIQKHMKTLRDLALRAIKQRI